MTAIEILEERIAEIEKQIYGSHVPAVDDPLPETTVIDSLLHINTLISSALSGREKTNALAKRLPQLNELLDTSYDDVDLNIQAKLEVILAMEDEVKKNLEMLNNLKKLMPALEVDRIKIVPELTPKLESLTVQYLKAYENFREIDVTIRELFSKYDNIIEIVSKSLISIDAAITNAEIAAAPQKQLD